MDKLELMQKFLESIEITPENEETMKSIMEAFNIARNWSFARDVNGPIKYGGLYYGFTDDDDEIPKAAQKKYGSIVPPDMAMGFAGGSGAGIQSMDSYGGGGLSGI